MPRGRPALAEAPTLTPGQQDQLDAERLRLGLSQAHTVQLAHFVTDAAMTWMALEAGVGALAWVFLLLSSLLQLARGPVLLRLQRSARYSPAQLMRFMSLSPLPVAVLQGALILAVMLQPASSWQYLLCMVVAAAAAGSVALAAGDAKGFTRVVVIVGGCVALGWLLFRGGAAGAVVAALYAVLMRVLVGYVREQGLAQQHLIRLNDELRLAHQRAEQANESRTRFFAAASHDLRQPLTALAYNVATVQAMAELSDNAALARVGQGLRRSLAESQSLLSSLLELSQLDAGAIEVQSAPLDLVQLVTETVESFAPQAEERGLLLLAEVQPSAGPWRCESDVALLRRVLHNLVGNALKFTLSGEVRVGLARAGGQLALSVSDSGPGIAPALQERVFEEFFQVGNPARNRSQGLGLGLSIVKRLVALLGLQLQLHSQPGLGSRFTMLLPRLDTDAAFDATVPRAVPTTSLMQDARPLRVLAIDDESAIRDALGQLLGALGWELRSAYNVTEALAHLADGWQPDALVLDFRLRQGVSGLDALAALRARGLQAPAWLVTGDTAPQRIQQAREAGIPVLYKPVDGMTLVAQIRAAVRSPHPPV